MWGLYKIYNLEYSQNITEDVTKENLTKHMTCI